MEYLFLASCVLHILHITSHFYGASSKYLLVSLQMRKSSLWKFCALAHTHGQEMVEQGVKYSSIHFAALGYLIF